jgi:eukaryotic-like serine/threonine-protein kinase
MLQCGLNRLIDQTPLNISQIIKYSIDFLSGLHHIHSKRLIHCDIKPTNILISNSNDAILTDFGLARYLNDDGLTIIDKFYHLHRAPETIQTNFISHHSDIFQAGLTIYRLCNGNAFFKNQLSKFYNKDNSFDEPAFISAIFHGKIP